jgi:hypothetical protein
MTAGLFRRAPSWLALIAAVTLLPGCTSATQGTTSSTTSTSTASAEDTTPVTTSSDASTSSITSTSSMTPTATSTTETVPAEASALPLPADNSTVDALNQQEKDDRAAIEAAWRKVWDLYAGIDEIPAADRPAKVNALMLDPLSSQLINGAAADDAAGVISYGSITLHPYWYRAVDGTPYAVIGDCADFSQFGNADRATGEKKTVGIKNRNTVGYFIHADDGWKLWNVTYVTDLACEPVG